MKSINVNTKHSNPNSESQGNCHFFYLPSNNGLHHLILKSQLLSHLQLPKLLPSSQTKPSLFPWKFNNHLKPRSAPLNYQYKTSKGPGIEDKDGISSSTATSKIEKTPEQELHGELNWLPSSNRLQSTFYLSHFSYSTSSSLSSTSPPPYCPARVLKR